MTASEVNKFVGDRIREHRSALDISQAALAVRLGVSPAWVSLAEGGHRSLSAVHLVTVAGVLGVKPGDLLPVAVTGG